MGNRHKGWSKVQSPKAKVGGWRRKGRSRALAMINPSRNEDMKDCEHRSNANAPIAKGPKPNAFGHVMRRLRRPRIPKKEFDPGLGLIAELGCCLWTKRLSPLTRWRSRAFP